MKRTITTLLSLCIPLAAVYAQSYTFKVKTETYTEFSGSEIAPPVWDEESGTLPLPFEMTMFGSTVNEITIADEYFTFSDNGTYIAYFAAFGADLKSRGIATSPIIIELFGESPNSILKAQVKNAGFAGDGTEQDYINYQVWLYEATGVIEVHYGDGSVANANGSFDGETGPMVGITESLLNDRLGLTGTPASPTTYNDPNTDMYLNGIPASGTVYVFTPSKFPASVNIVSNEVSINAYPNPVSDKLTVELNGTNQAEIMVTDVTGKVMYEGVITDNAVIETQDFKQGIYFIRVKTATGVVTERIIKN